MAIAPSRSPYGNELFRKADANVSNSKELRIKRLPEGYLWRSGVASLDLVRQLQMYLEVYRRIEKDVVLYVRDLNQPQKTANATPGRTLVSPVKGGNTIPTTGESRCETLPNLGSHRHCARCLA